MKSTMRLFCFLLAILLVPTAIPVFADGEDRAALTSGAPATPVVSDTGVGEGALSLDCRSAILMEASTGTVLYVQNADEALPPASVTKVMTLLLVMEAIDSGVLRMEDTVTVSGNAASMGGSQVFLKEGEQMSVEEMLKCVVIASANDAAVALAEHLCGTVPAFVARMNERAGQLGMEHTHFENVTGLDDAVENHLTSARDIALMSRALIAHPAILQYSSIWMDDIRNGEFGLTNTNRLVRFYPGCTGLKTGSTSKAGFCVSATAERDGFSLICVIMGAPGRDVRNAAAASLLDWGFANYGLFTAPAADAGEVPVAGGTVRTCPVGYGVFSCVLPKAELGGVSAETVLPESLSAPIRAGDAAGEVTYRCGDRVLGILPVKALTDVPRLGFAEILRRMTAAFLLT